MTVERRAYLAIGFAALLVLATWWLPSPTLGVAPADLADFAEGLFVGVTAGVLLLVIARHRAN